MARSAAEPPFKTGNGVVRKYETSMSTQKLSPSIHARGADALASVKRNQVVQKDLARYYTNLLGQKDQNPVNAYMAVGESPALHQSAGNGLPSKKIKKKNKKKLRAQSHAGGAMLAKSKDMGGATQSSKNMLTIESELGHHQVIDNRTEDGASAPYADIQSEQLHDGAVQ